MIKRLTSSILLILLYTSSYGDVGRSIGLEYTTKDGEMHFIMSDYAPTTELLKGNFEIVDDEHFTVKVSKPPFVGPYWCIVVSPAEICQRNRDAFCDLAYKATNEGLNTCIKYKAPDAHLILNCDGHLIFFIDAKQLASAPILI